MEPGAGLDDPFQLRMFYNVSILSLSTIVNITQLVFGTANQLLPTPPKMERHLLVLPFKKIA